MEAVRRLFKFGAGGAFGAAVGVVVASLMAPQNGEEFQEATRNRIAEVKAEGAAAQADTEARMAERFRSQVKDRSALTGMSTPK